MRSFYGEREFDETQISQNFMMLGDFTMNMGMKRKLHSFLSLLVALAMLFIGVAVTGLHAGASGSESSVLPIDPAGAAHGTGYVPSEEVYPPQPPRVMPFSVYPAQYPSGVNYANMAYTLYRVNQVQSPVKNQDRTGLCWNFASMGAIEAATIKAGRGVIDLSEVNAAHALSTASGNSMYGYSNRPSPNDGGNADMIMAYAMRDGFSGFVDQADDYAALNTQLAARPLAQTAAERRSYTVPGGYQINTAQASVAEIKKAVTQHGGVTTTMYGDSTGWQAYFNETTSAYYLPSASGYASNHLVLIVGWDDDYPIANFSTNKPTSNGAWLVKNSWGPSWGSSGYFWISYQDKYAGLSAWAFEPAATMTTADFTNKVYDYGMPSSAYYSQTYGTNVFTAGTSAETLKQVRVFINAAPQYNVPVFLTNGYTAAGQVAATITANVPVATFDAPYVGYYTIDIPSQPTIAANAKFAVTVRHGGTVPVQTLRTPGSGVSFIGASGATQDISTSGYAVRTIAVTAPAASAQLAAWTSLTANGTPSITATTSLTLTFDKNVTLSTGDITVWGATKGALTGSGSTYQLAVSGSFNEGDLVTVALKITGKSSPEIRTAVVHKPVSKTNVTWTSLMLNTGGGTANTEDTYLVWGVFDVDPLGLAVNVSDYNNPYVTVTGATCDRISSAGYNAGFGGYLYRFYVSNLTVGEGQDITITLTNPPDKNISPLTRTVAVHRKTTIAWAGATANGKHLAESSTEVFLSFDGAVHNLSAANFTVTGATKGALTLVDDSYKLFALAISDITVASGSNITIAMTSPAGYTVAAPTSKSIPAYVAPPSPTYGVMLDKTGTQTFTDATAGYDAPGALAIGVQNMGNQPTGALTVALSGTNAASFTLSKDSIDSIAVSGSDGFTVVPKTSLAVGTHTATVTVSGSNSISASFNVSFTVLPVPTYGVTLDKTGTQAFPDETVGYGAPSALTVAVQNTGNQPTGALTVALSGTNASSFTLNEISISSIAVSGNDGFTVVPKTSLAVGSHIATVTVGGSNGISASFNVSFTVLPVPTYGVTLDKIGTQTFPDATAGYGAQSALTVGVQNSGNQLTGTLTVALSGTNAPNFTLSKTSIVSLAVSGSDSFTVVPKIDLAAGTYTAMVTVSGNNGISATFDVSFTVTPAPTYGVMLDQTGMHTFTSATLGYSAQSVLTVGVQSSGNQPTGALTVALSGTNASSFTLSKTSISSVAVSGSDSFTVVPKTGLAAGTHTATVTVSGGNGISASFTVSFTVNKKALTVNVSVSNKPYDGLATASIATASLVGVIAGQDVALATPYPTATFADSAVGNGIGISFSGSFGLVGADAGNYTLTQPTGVTANITAGFTPAKSTHYTASTLNPAGWTKTDFAITAASGYQISTTGAVGGLWTETLTRSGETASGSVVFYLRNTATGEISVAATESYKLDRTAPTLQVQYNSNPLKAFFNTVTLGLFFKANVTVTIIGADENPGFTVEYYKAPAPADPLSITGWVAGSSFSVALNEKFVLYTRVTDVAGNTVIAFEGVVVYTDSELAVTANFSMDAAADLPVAIAMNSNTVKAVLYDGFEVASGNYTVGTNTITLKNAYLKTLGEGTHTFTVYYDPLGETTAPSAPSQVPGTTVITVVSTIPPDIAGLTSLLRSVSYSGTTSVSYTVTGTGVTVTQDTTHGGKIVWNPTTKTLDIAAGLDIGVYPVVLTAGNGNAAQDFTHTFILTITAAPTYGIALDKTGTQAFPDAVEGYGAQDAMTVAVENTGIALTGALTAALSGPNAASFTLSKTAFAGIVVSDSFTVTPKTGLAAGTYTATVTVSGSNDILAAFEVSFTVTAVPAYGVSLDQTGTQAFPDATVGYDAQDALTVAVQNTGNQPTGTLTAALSGPNAADFTLSKTGISSLAVDGSASFTVVPKTGLAAGTYTATVTVTGGNGISATFNVSFTVTAVPTYGVSLDQTGTQVFNSAIVGYEAQGPRTVIMLNAGNQPTDALTITLSGTNAAGFVLSKTSINSLAVGGSASFAVAPKTGLAAGTYTATVTVTGGNGISATFNVSFTVERKMLTLNVTISNKPYDGLTTAEIATLSLGGVTLGDDVSIVYPYPVASFADSEIGEGKPISFDGVFTLTGADADNYTLIQPTGITANITRQTPAFLRGDVTQDGAVDIDDILAVRAHMFGIAELSGDRLLIALDLVSGGSTVDIDVILAIRAIMFGTAPASATVSVPVEAPAAIPIKGNIRVGAEKT